MDYLKIGKATELSGRDRKLYRAFEIFPGAFSLGTLGFLALLSYLEPVWAAYVIIAFDVYWLLLVVYLAIYTSVSFRKIKHNQKVDWQDKCQALIQGKYGKDVAPNALCRQGVAWSDLWQLVILPTYNESAQIIETALRSVAEDRFPNDHLIVVLAMEERAGEEAKQRADQMRERFGPVFPNFLITFHPDGIIGELKGKGANQAWAAKEAVRAVIDPRGLDYSRILVSVFDIDTVIPDQYFFALAYKFLTVDKPHRASYQPIPVYNNNIWQAPFFSRVAASSNTFWQMIMGIRQEKLVTYSSHSMTFQALNDIGYWPTNMVSEDSRIFWNCLLYYQGDYRVEPLYLFISMDATLDQGILNTAASLYKQQRRWAWGAENLPYLFFNLFRNTRGWSSRGRLIVAKHILIQIYGFHSWATNALIVGVIGWLPVLLGGERFNSTVLSGNLPQITSDLMNLAMIGLVLSAIFSNLLLPKRPKGYSPWKSVIMVLQWIFVPVNVTLFGALPCLDAQIRLMRGKYMGFWVTPKER